ncbi:hypothetical protein ACE193_09075 [Bernardetia sp. OM2101]|uniref:hypothetical protein n=1 Tax=Bernardetia sp. OM2101 TaxID=3344876 RepID=UPI0035CEE6D2
MKKKFHILSITICLIVLYSCKPNIEKTSDDVKAASVVFSQFLDSHQVPCSYKWNVKAFKPLAGDNEEYILTMKVYDLKILDESFEMYAKRVASLGSLLLYQSIGDNSSFTKFGVSILSHTGKKYKRQYTLQELKAASLCLENASKFMQTVVKDSVDFSYHDFQTKDTKSVVEEMFELSETNLGKIETSLPSSFYFKDGTKYQLRVIMGAKRKDYDKITHITFSMDTSTHKIIYLSLDAEKK